MTDSNLAERSIMAPEEELAVEVNHLALQAEDRIYDLANAAKKAEFARLRRDAQTLQKSTQQFQALLDDTAAESLDQSKYKEEQGSRLGEILKTGASIENGLTRVRRLDDYVQDGFNGLKKGVKALRSNMIQTFQLEERTEKAASILKAGHPWIFSPNLSLNTDESILNKRWDYTFKVVDKVIKPYASALWKRPYVCLVCWVIIIDRTSNLSLPILPRNGVPVCVRLQDIIGQREDSTDDRKLILSSAHKLVQLINPEIQPEILQRLPVVMVAGEKLASHGCFENCSNYEWADVTGLVVKGEYMKLDSYISDFNKELGKHADFTKPIGFRSSTHISKEYTKHGSREMNCESPNKESKRSKVGKGHVGYKDFKSNQSDQSNTDAVDATRGGKNSTFGNTEPSSSDLFKIFSHADSRDMEQKGGKLIDAIDLDPQANQHAYKLKARAKFYGLQSAPGSKSGRSHISRKMRPQNWRL